jgi:carboxyl-terminal processing protease
VIRTIDGRAPQDILRYHLKRIGGGTIEYRTNQAIKFLLFSHEPNDAEIELTTKKKIRVSRVRSTGTPTSPNVHQRLLQKKYLYLKIPAWDPNVLTADVISALVKKRNEARGVIIDVRGNGGGSTVPAFQVASYFLQNTTSFGEVRIKNRRKTLLVPPHPDATNTPLAVLTDIECLSSNEIFIAGLHDSGRAIVIGETTGGSSGNPTLITIPFRDGSFTVKVATWNYVRPNGKRLEGKGIQPDLVVHANTKKDEALLKAIKYIKKKNS